MSSVGRDTCVRLAMPAANCAAAAECGCELPAALPLTAGLLAYAATSAPAVPGNTCAEARALWQAR
jgi:hypothetical protein